MNKLGIQYSIEIQLLPWTLFGALTQPATSAIQCSGTFKI
jgi:hypothetical protein